MAADHAWSEVGGLTGADVTDRTSISDPASVMKHAAPEHAAVQNGEGQWIAFSLPVLDETRSPCCWKGRWNGFGEAGCSLERKHESYGTRSDSPLADEFPQRSQVLLLEVIGSEKDEEVLEQAVFAITQLPGDTGSQMLLDLASDDQYPREVRRQALFWLANSEDENAVAALTELLIR